jgi:predicted DCC family thiol-disulfide oxidoreductase YuxK
MLLRYDDDCGLCTRAVAWLSSHSAGVTFVPLDEQRAAVVLQFDDGTETTGVQAVAAVLRTGTGMWPRVGRFMQYVPVRQICELAYRIVARNRRRISRALGWQACSVPQRHP